jgi:hypothetical protein
MPDSPTPRCQEGACTLQGEDGDYRTSISSFTTPAHGVSASPLDVGYYATDSLTGLTWLVPYASASTMDAGLVSPSLAEALSDCSAFATQIASTTTFTVPTTIELLTLLDMGLDGGSAVTDLNMPLQTGPYWTVTGVDAGGTLVVNFATGGYAPAGTNGFTGSTFVICVEAPTATQAPTWDPVPNAGVSGSSQVFIDRRTGLEWAQLTDSGEAWSGALSACNALAADTCSDWRLPSYKELATLISTTGELPAGLPVVVDKAWTSTATVNALSSATTSYDEVFFASVMRGNGTVEEPRLGTSLGNSSSQGTLCVRNAPP